MSRWCTWPVEPPPPFPQKFGSGCGSCLGCLYLVLLGGRYVMAYAHESDCMTLFPGCFRRPCEGERS